MSREGVKPDVLSAESTPLDRALFKCRMAENAERFDDMVENVKEVCKLTKDALGANERNYLSVAYKNSVATRRAALRCIASMKTRYEARGAKVNVEAVNEYYGKLVDELEGICKDVINLVDTEVMPERILTTLVDDRGTREFRVFFIKIKADYYRYLAEFADGKKREEAIENAAKYYEEAVKVACTSENGDESCILPPPHPIRLGLFLNYSVFQYEIQEKPEEAKKIAKQAFDDALDKLDTAGEMEYKDSTLILQLLRDNSTLWSAQDGLTADNGADGAAPTANAAPPAGGAP